jgi:hypothetical protein
VSVIACLCYGKMVGEGKAGRELGWH